MNVHQNKALFEAIGEILKEQRAESVQALAELKKIRAPSADQ